MAPCEGEKDAHRYQQGRKRDSESGQASPLSGVFSIHVILVPITFFGSIRRENDCTSVPEKFERKAASSPNLRYWACSATSIFQKVQSLNTWVSVIIMGSPCKERDAYPIFDLTVSGMRSTKFFIISSRIGENPTMKKPCFASRSSYI